MPFTIIRQDLTKMKVDAIVNATNTELQIGGGVCEAIFKAAGVSKLKKACDNLAPIKIGDAVITPGFGLKAKFVVHTARPIYSGGQKGEEQQLRLCYINSLKRAMENNCKSIAFPLISSGIHGYPKDAALRVASKAIQDFLWEHEMEVYLAVFDKAAFDVSEKLLGEVASYIDEHYVSEQRLSRRELRYVNIETYEKSPFTNVSALEPKLNLKAKETIDNLIGNLDESFSVTLLRLIDAKGMTDVEVYKRANIDRKLFSKIRTGKGYMPSKRTAVALAVAMKLSLEETEDLLGRAGYTLSRSQKFDVIVEYFIVSSQYDIFEINEVLLNFDQLQLGG